MLVTELLKIHIFKENPMSTTPDAPKRTLTIVKDLLFQEKYQLTHTETDLMAYLVNVTYWAMELAHGYYPITTNKVLSDLPALKLKTFEASLKRLKDLNLIATKLVVIDEWHHSHKVRAIQLSDEAKLYNSHLNLPPQDDIHKALRKEIKALKIENEALTEKNIRLEEIMQTLDIPKEDDAKKFQRTHKIPINYSPNTDLVSFIEHIKKTFIKTGDPICNFIPNWEKETTFYINSYGKLSSLPKNGKEKQVKDASEINDFWLHLFANQNKVGKLIDFSKPLDLAELKSRYIGAKIVINSKELTISDFIEEGEFIHIEIIKEGKRNRLINSETKEVAVFTIGLCEEMMLQYR